METKCIKLVPPCYTMSGEWYDAEQRCYVPAPQEPVYVMIKGRKREAKRWLELWRLIARIQIWLMQYTQRNA